MNEAVRPRGTPITENLCKGSFRLFVCLFASERGVEGDRAIFRLDFHSPLLKCIPLKKTQEEQTLG